MRVKRIIPEWRKPVATERQYKALLVNATNEYLAEVKRSLESIDLDTSLRADEDDSDREIRADGIIEDLAVMFRHFQAVANAKYAGPIASLPRIFSRVSMFNDKQWRRVIKVGTGFDFPASREKEFTSSSGLGINTYRGEPWLDKMQEAWTSNNTDLIKTLPDNFNVKLNQMVKSAVVNGTSAKTLADQIQDEFNTTRYRAELIAIDQIQKANSALAEQRQRDVGVTGYIWRGSMDARERLTHKAREGKHFEWDNPPPDGHPGQPVRCRCTAEPDFTGTLFDVGE